MPNMILKGDRGCGPARLQDRAGVADNRGRRRTLLTPMHPPTEPPPDPSDATESEQPGHGEAAPTALPEHGSGDETAPAAADLSPAACGARLAELFPALFAAPGAPGPVKPIKLRIHADIHARAPDLFSKRVLGLFFSRYTTTNAYLKALVNAPSRFDLDGAPAGEIAAEHRQAASEELARRHALAAERRAAQRPQPPRREATGAEGSDATQGERRGARTEGRRGPPPGDRAKDRPPRPPRPPQASRTHDGLRPERTAGARPPRAPERPPQHALPESAPRTHDAIPPAAPLPTDPAQRERAMLLRSFESSPLSKANFCALKRITEAALDAALAQAQAERGAPSPTPAQRSGGRR
jgi:ProP effector